MVNDEVTAGYAKELFGNIVGFSLAGSRRALQYKYEQEAQHAYMTQSFEVALDRFCHLLALLETDPSTTVISEMRATLTCNIGASLYGNDQPELAMEWFEKGLAEFQKLPFTLYSRVTNFPIWIVYGNVNEKRIEYIQARIADIKAGKKADGSTYQDAYGKARQWSQHEMEGKPTWSWLSPLSWFGYGQLTEVAATSDTPAATAA